MLEIVDVATEAIEHRVKETMLRSVDVLTEDDRAFFLGIDLDDVQEAIEALTENLDLLVAPCGHMAKISAASILTTDSFCNGEDKQAVEIHNPLSAARKALAEVGMPVQALQYFPAMPPEKLAKHIHRRCPNACPLRSASFTSRRMDSTFPLT